MKNEYLEGQLVALLKVMDQKNLRQFSDFVNSPIFNKNKKVGQLFSLLRPAHPAYEKVSKIQLYQAIFGTKTEYNDTRFRSLVSMLKKLAERFFAHQEFEENQFSQKLATLENLLKRNALAEMTPLINSLTKSTKETTIKDSDFLYNAYRLEELAYQHLMITNNRAKKTNLQSVCETLDRYYLATKLRYLAVLLNRQRVVNDPILPWLLEELLSFLEKHDFSDWPAIKLYHQVILLLQKPEKENLFEPFKTALLDSVDRLPVGEIRQLFTMLLNYCRWKANEGNPAFSARALAIYQFLLERKILLVNGSSLSPHNFRNIVRTALEVGEDEWAACFISEYEPFVPEKWRQAVVRYNWASVYFYRKNYLQAAQTLHSLNQGEDLFFDIFYQLHFKTLELQLVFEQGDDDFLQARFNALRMFLTRTTKLPNHYKESYGNFMKLLAKINNLKTNLTSAKQKALAAEISSCSPLVKREWLLQKLTKA